MTQLFWKLDDHPRL